MNANRMSVAEAVAAHQTTGFLASSGDISVIATTGNAQASTMIYEWASRTGRSPGPHRQRK